MSFSLPPSFFFSVLAEHAHLWCQLSGFCLCIWLNMSNYILILWSSEVASITPASLCHMSPTSKGSGELFTRLLWVSLDGSLSFPRPSKVGSLQETRNSSPICFWFFLFLLSWSWRSMWIYNRYDWFDYRFHSPSYCRPLAVQTAPH